MRGFAHKRRLFKKNGLKLSLVCSLHWLFRFVVTAQRYFFYGVLVVLMTYLMPHDLREMAVYIFVILLLVKCLENLLHVGLSSDPMRLRIFFQSVMALVFFVAGSSSVYQDHFSALVLNRLILLCLMNLVGGRLVDVFQSKLFKSYLFQKVIDKEYLRNGKTVEDLPSESSLHVDVEERDADKRMRRINQNVVKQDYQGIVELSFLNREVRTEIGSKVVWSRRAPERVFQDSAVQYYLVFKVYPFGFERLSYTLIIVKVNQNKTFRFPPDLSA